jgi:hypothetical protein
MPNELSFPTSSLSATAASTSFTPSDSFANSYNDMMDMSYIAADPFDFVSILYKRSVNDVVIRMMFLTSNIAISES